jgi:hypothetical protein
MGEGYTQSEVLLAVLHDHQQGSTATSPATPPPPVEAASDTGQQEVSTMFGLHPSFISLSPD